MPLFVNAINAPASFTISLAALSPVSGISWSSTGVPPGIQYTTSDDTGITFTAFPTFVNNKQNMSVRATLDDGTTASAAFAISSGSSAILPAASPFITLPVTTGLVGQYDGASWNNALQVWVDRSGNGNNTSPEDVRGTINYDSTNGFIYGATTAGIRLPNALFNTANYTFIHLAKYNNGVKARIFQGVSIDWASGFINGKAGVAFHNGYITQSAADLYNYNWVISTDQRNKYRAQSVDFTTGTAGSPGYGRVGLNYGLKTAEYSTWAVAEILVYNRVLTDSEIVQVENYLRTKYLFLSIQIDTTTGSTFTVPQSNQQASAGTIEWSYKTPLPTGVTFTGSGQLGANFAIATGTLLANVPFSITASGNGGQAAKNFNLLGASRTVLSTPNVAIDTTSANTFTIAQTANGTGAVTWAYSTLPLGVAFSTSGNTRLVFSVAAQTVVAPTTITITATNVLKTPTIQSFTYGAGVKPVLTLVSANPTSALDSTSVKTFQVTQAVVDAFTGGITWSYSTLPTGLSVTSVNSAATFTVAAGSVIPLQTITVTATNLGGVSTVLTFQLGAATKTVLTSPDRLLNTQSAAAQFTISQTAANTGTITWSYTLPTNLTFVSQSSSGITFQVARNLVIASQTFTVTATNSVGTPTSLSITLGAGTPPTLGNPGNLILNTTVINQSFTITQDKNPAYTGAISWSISPAPGTFPAGVSVSSQNDYGTTILILVGSVLPYQLFTFTATAVSGWSVQRTLNVGASSIVQLQSPGDPQLLDTTTSKTVTIAQIYNPALTGPVTWQITPSSYPAGMSITTQTDSQTIFTFAQNTYLTRQQFTIIATSAGGLTSQIQFDMGAAVKPIIGTISPAPVSGLISLNTYTGAKTITIPQTVNASYTGAITWTTNPTTLPGSTTKTPSNTQLVLTTPTQPTGVIFPTTTFTITATGPLGFASSTSFDVFAPRIPSVNAVSPGTRTVDVSSAAYTSITVTQSATDALPVTWSYSPTTSGVTINSSTGLFTIAQATYFTATTFTATATNPVGSTSSTSFTVTTPAPPVIDTTSPTSPQTIDTSATAQTFSFTNTASLTGTLTWSLPGTPPSGVTINSSTGVLTIAQGTYFTATAITVRVTNPVGVYNERSVTVTTPAVPTVTSSTSSPQTLEVTTAARTIQFTQSTSLVGTVTWSYTPTTSGVTIDSNGLLTIAQATYFTATTFTVKATNSVGKFGTLNMTVTTPAPPVIDTTSPTSGQNVDVSTTAQTFSFTNTASLTGTLTWSLTGTVPTGTSINSSSGVLTVTQGSYYTASTFTVRVVNPVGISNTRSFTITTPTPPVITGPTVSVGNIVGSRVYINNTVSSRTVSISQTATNTGTITWTGTGSLPTGVTKTTENNTTLTFTIGTTAVLRPAASAFSRSNYATNPAGKSSSTITYDVFTPAAPVLGTPSPAPSSGTITLDTSSTSKTITINQTTAAANTDPITWTTSPSDLGTGVSLTTSDTQIVVTINSSITVVPAVAVTVTATNRAGMAASSSFNLYVPAAPSIDPIGTQYASTKNGNASFSVIQRTISADNGITWTVTTPLPSGVSYAIVPTTASVVGGLTFTITQGTIITAGSSITVTATNAAGAQASRTFTLYAGDPPALTNPGTQILDTTSSQTITVTNTGGTSPTPTWSTSTLPTGVTLSSSSSTQAVLTVAPNSDFAATNITVTATTALGASSVTFSTSAAVKPVLGSPSSTGVVDSTSQTTVTVSQTKSTSIGITWSVSPALPTGITGSGTDTTYTFTVGQNASTAASDYTLTASTRSSSASTTVNIGAGVKPVVTTISDYVADTYNIGTLFKATVTDTTNMTNISWSISGPSPYVYIVNTGGPDPNIYGQVGWSQTGVETDGSYTVTATNGYGQSGSKSFNLKLGVIPRLSNLTGLGPYNVTSGSVTFGPLTVIAGTGTITWGLSNPPSGVSINSTTGVITIAQNTILDYPTGISVDASNNIGYGGGSAVIKTTYIRYFGISAPQWIAPRTQTITYILIGPGGRGGNQQISGNSSGGGGGGQVKSGRYTVGAGRQYTFYCGPTQTRLDDNYTGTSVATAVIGNAGGNGTSSGGGAGGSSGSGKAGGSRFGFASGGGGGDSAAGQNASGTSGSGGGGAGSYAPHDIYGWFGKFGGGGGAGSTNASQPQGVDGGGNGAIFVVSTDGTGFPGTNGTGGGGGGASGINGRQGGAGGTGSVIICGQI